MLAVVVFIFFALALIALAVICGYILLVHVLNDVEYKGHEEQEQEERWDE